MDTIRFARPESNKTFGCFVYLLVVVALGLFVGLMAAALGVWAAESAKLSEGFQMAAAALGGLGGFALVARFGWRDYRRRADEEVLVRPDGLVVAGTRTRVELLFADVRTVRLRFEGADPNIELEAVDGRRVRPPVEIAPFESLNPPLLERLLPGMLERFEAELAAGTTVPMRESGARAIGRILWGLTLILLIGPLVALTIRYLLRAPSVFILGAYRIRQGWRGRSGGFSITSDGLLPPGEEVRAVPWRELTLEVNDAHGMSLRSMEGQRLGASLFAENYWALSRLVAERLK